MKSETTPATTMIVRPPTTPVTATPNCPVGMIPTTARRSRIPHPVAGFQLVLGNTSVKPDEPVQPGLGDSPIWANEHVPFETPLSTAKQKKKKRKGKSKTPMVARLRKNRQLEPY